VVTVYDTATGKPVAEHPGHDGGVEAVGFAADGRTVFTSGWDATVRRWDPATGRELGRAAIDPALGGAAAAAGLTYPMRAVAFSPDGRFGVGSYGLVDTATGKSAAKLSLPGV
jgi:WD40 repeat protein